MATRIGMKRNKDFMNSKWSHHSKGQLISKFWCHRIDQKTNEIFLRISALASKEFK